MIEHGLEVGADGVSDVRPGNQRFVDQFPDQHRGKTFDRQLPDQMQTVRLLQRTVLQNRRMQKPRQDRLPRHLQG